MRSPLVLAAALCLAACAAPEPPVRVGPPALPSVGPGNSPSSPPTVAPATPSPEPTPTPLRCPDGSLVPSPPNVDLQAPSPGDPIAIVTGRVLDADGRPADEARVEVRSLEAATPYQAMVTTFQGNWVVNNIPEGVLLEISAEKGGLVADRVVSRFTRWYEGCAKPHLVMRLEALPPPPSTPPIGATP